MPLPLGLAHLQQLTHLVQDVPVGHARRRQRKVGGKGRRRRHRRHRRWRRRQGREVDRRGVRYVTLGPKSIENFGLNFSLKINSIYGWRFPTGHPNLHAMIEEFCVFNVVASHQCQLKICNTNLKFMKCSKSGRDFGSLFPILIVFRN